ncbi:MAG: glucose 1-dehydrogenase [Planctomycetota bacterium]
MLQIDLSGQVAVVTGGSRGIGRACVETLAKAGARVVFGYRDGERQREVEAVVAEVERGGSQAVAYQSDLREPGAAAALVDLAQSTFGSIDVVVNNAGVWERASLTAMADEALRETVDLNLEAMFRVTQAAVRHMQGQVSGGRVIQIASTAGERGEAQFSHYAASKGATIAMVKSLARELAPKIRVNAVSPGWVDTEMTAGELTGNRRVEVEQSIPLGRVGRPVDIANAVAFLASDLSSWVTGATLRVNGGSLLVDG